MPWYKLPLVFRACSPVHVGAGTLGFINLTRYYIPARNLWATLTRRLVETFVDNPSFNLYQDYGRFVNEGIRFSYLYPAIEKGGDWKIFAPTFSQDSLRYGELVDSEFQDLFISSYVSTALDGMTSSADEGMLHEVEFLLDKIKDPQTGTLRQVYYLGELYYRSPDGDKIENRDKNISLNYNQLIYSLSSLLIGGDICYGLGEIILDYNLIGRKEMCTEGDQLELQVEGEELILKAHTTYQQNIEFKGDVELIVSRNWHQEKGPGRQLSYEGIFFTPGTIIKLTGFIIKIGEYGFWELYMCK